MLDWSQNCGEHPFPAILAFGLQLAKGEEECPDLLLFGLTPGKTRAVLGDFEVVSASDSELGVSKYVLLTMGKPLQESGIEVKRRTRKSQPEFVSPLASRGP